jgi:hypothetical protein
MPLWLGDFQTICWVSKTVLVNVLGRTKSNANRVDGSSWVYKRGS